ncbi:hypothetical protein PoB_001127700 [Plakobranchus ocellatus]|uniref:Uncharacterized protein n=1 Tax=Plakobranchus ocellatus TaxID=259542 RepID=A0AAV3YRK2_9GAST|nr:hypothetical protein PoB_001127700 [Plakobranchus ocellatus]
MYSYIIAGGLKRCFRWIRNNCSSNIIMIRSRVKGAELVEMGGPQQFASNISQPGAIEVELGENAELGLEIYGYPIPHLLTMMKTRDSTNLTGSARHLIEYSPGQTHFGFVNVTIVFVEKEDFTNYTITVDNGVGDPLVYPFYLVEVKATVNVKQEEQGGSEDDAAVIAVSVTVAVVAVK